MSLTQDLGSATNLQENSIGDKWIQDMHNDVDGLQYPSEVIQFDEHELDNILQGIDDEDLHVTGTVDVLNDEAKENNEVEEEEEEEVSLWRIDVDELEEESHEEIPSHPNDEVTETPEVPNEKDHKEKEENAVYGDEERVTHQDETREERVTESKEEDHEEIPSHPNDEVTDPPEVQEENELGEEDEEEVSKNGTIEEMAKPTDVNDDKHCERSRDDSMCWKPRTQEERIKVERTRFVAQCLPALFTEDDRYGYLPVNEIERAATLERVDRFYSRCEALDSAIKFANLR